MRTQVASPVEPILDELTAEHRRLDERVRELERRVSLTPTEQVELSRLKKEKLRTKDRIRAATARISS